MDRIKSCLLEMLFQRMLVLAECEQDDKFRNIYITFLRNVEKAQM